MISLGGCWTTSFHAPLQLQVREASGDLADGTFHIEEPSSQATIRSVPGKDYEKALRLHDLTMTGIFHTPSAPYRGAVSQSIARCSHSPDEVRVHFRNPTFEFEGHHLFATSRNSLQPCLQDNSTAVVYEGVARCLDSGAVFEIEFFASGDLEKGSAQWSEFLARLSCSPT